MAKEKGLEPLANLIRLEQPQTDVLKEAEAPAEPKKGDTCYKMLIDASTLRLFWIKKHKISGEGDAGFRKEDLRALSRGR